MKTWRDGNNGALSHERLMNAEITDGEGRILENAYRTWQLGKGWKVRSAYESYFILRPFFPDFNRERLVVCGLDKNMNVTCASQLFCGGRDGIKYVNPNRLFNELLGGFADYYVICHNHPDGHSLKPSGMDLDSTKKWERMGKEKGLIMLDHMILGGDRYWSFRRHGELPRLRDADFHAETEGLIDWREYEGWFGRKSVGDIIW